MRKKYVESAEHAALGIFTEWTAEGKRAGARSLDLGDLKNATTIIVPVKNEAPTLGGILSAASQYCTELIVVDGHSEDGSLTIAKQAGARCIIDHAQGKGEAIRCAIPCISNEVTVFMDGDGSHDPEDIPKLVEPILNGEFEHVTGSRLIGGSSELHGGFDEFLRLAGSSFITACINTRFKVRLSDSQNGFRAIKTDVLRQLDLRENITTIEQEMIIDTLKKGFRIGEVPAHEYRRKYGKSKIRVSRVWPAYGWCLLRSLFF